MVLLADSFCLLKKGLHRNTAWPVCGDSTLFLETSCSDIFQRCRFKARALALAFHSPCSANLSSFKINDKMLLALWSPGISSYSSREAVQ